MEMAKSQAINKIVICNIFAYQIENIILLVKWPMIWSIELMQFDKKFNFKTRAVDDDIDNDTDGAIRKALHCINLLLQMTTKRANIVRLNFIMFSTKFSIQ